MMSLLLDEVALAALRLAEAGVESPRTDAELIAASVHNVRRGELHMVPDSDFDARFWADIARRAAREPLQHITGRAHFRYLELDVGPGVFVPRPETEVMTGWAIARLREMDVAEPVVADLGTGSGAIALAIGQEVPRARVHAVEADPLARAWAERNVSRYVESAPYTAGRVMLHAGDFADALGDLDGTVDLVISNPPYIPVGAYVEPEVSEYDPPAALWSGTDGLDAIRAVERTARRLLRPGGLVAVEHGAQQGAAVYWVFPEESGWRDTRNNKDLAGRDRFVTAAWSGEGRAMSKRYDCRDPQERTAGIDAAVTAARGRRADRAADGHGVRHRRGRVHPGVGHHHAGGQGPGPEHAAAGARRHRAGRGGAGGRPRRVRAGPDRRVLAGRAHPGVPGQPDAAVGPGRHQGHGGPADAAARGRARRAQADRADGGVQRQPARPARRPITADEAEQQLGEAVSVYLDGGPCADNVPSTILDLTGTIPKVLRSGAISVDRLRAVSSVIAENEHYAEGTDPAADFKPGGAASARDRSGVADPATGEPPAGA